MPMTRNNIHHCIYIFVKIDNYLISSGYKLLWVIENRNNITEFILLGLSQKKEIEILCFLQFLLCCNSDQKPIFHDFYCLQSTYEAAHVFLSEAPLPRRPLLHLQCDPQVDRWLAGRSAGSIACYHGCMTQLFTMHFFAGMRSSSSRGRPMIAMWPSASLCAALWSWPDRSALPWSLLPALGASCIPSVSFSWPSFYTTVAPTK